MIFIRWDLHVEISNSILTETQSINTILEVDSYPIPTLGSKHTYLEKFMEKAQADKGRKHHWQNHRTPNPNSIALQQPLALRRE